MWVGRVAKPSRWTSKGSIGPPLGPRPSKPSASSSKMGSQIPFDHQELAHALAGTDHVPEIPGRDSQSDLHDQRDRIVESLVTQDQQKSRGLSQPGIVAQALLPGFGTDRQKVDHADL